MDLAGFRNSIWPEPDPDLGKLVLGSYNNMPDEINGVTNADSCYKEAVQFGTSLFANFWQNLWNSNEFVFLSPE